MSRYGGWAPYVPVAERRRKAMREMEKLRKKGHPVAPVVINGRAIATTFWGKSWCENLESYHDYENRLPRGRTYARNGSVVDLQIASKEVLAMVSGSSLYKVKISVNALPTSAWKAICKDCSGGIDSLVELLQGRFNKGVMDRLCRQDNGLFPKPSEIHFSCSCPDYASMCKHIAAVLYGIGSRLDEQPELLFLLRAVNQNDLVVNLDAALPIANQGPEAGKLLETDDISQLFGLDMAGGDFGSAKTKTQPSPAKITGKQKSTKPGKPRSTIADEQENRNWLEVEELISSRTPLGYAKATAKLIEMCDSARKTRKIKKFAQRLVTLRSSHERKRRLIERLDAAGLIT
ncbi:MAG: SWIM zinc finger family protein [Magnetococcales bacterium]|nr:SWIM zinc finger family protein [Magnetococcales bacterium]